MRRLWALLFVVIGQTCAAAQRPDAVALDGAWEFRFAPDDRGSTERWYQPGTTFDRRLNVPGCWDAQGVGEPTDKMRHNAVGVGWYRRAVTLPAGWRGRRLWLNVGGVHRSARVWFNGVSVGEHIGYPTSFRLDVTAAVRPDAPQQVVLAVDSRHDKARDPLVGAFDVIDYMDLTWGGITESVTLDSTGDGWIDDAFAVGDPAAHRAQLRLTLAGTAGDQVICRTRGGDGRVYREVTVAPRGDQTTLSLDLAGAPLWTPESPNLLTSELILRRAGQVLDRTEVRFGLRRLETTADGFRLNGDRFWLRGYGDDYTFPLTIAAPANVPAWKRYLQRRREFGFNGVRHHSTMLGESYLRAADEVGMFVQPELPIAYDQFLKAATPRGKDLYRQVWRDYIRQMRNHPSVMAWCMGNEQWDGWEMGPELYDVAKGLDPTRPAIDTDGQWPGHTRRTIDYLTVLFDEWCLPWAGTRGKYAAKQAGRPVVVHEMSNISTLPDPAEIPRYNGVIRPFWLEQMRDAVERRHLTAQLPALRAASSRLQASVLKLNLEAARLQPGIDGYYQWLFRDYWTQSSGFVNQFDEERAISPAFARQFNSPAVVLWDHNRAGYRAGEPVPVRLFVSDFRPASAVPLGPVTARLGELPIALKPPPAGETRGLLGPWTGEIAAPTLTAGARLELVASAGDVTNRWSIWVYPTPAPAAEVVVQRRLTPPLLDKLEAGATLLVAGDAGPFPSLTARFKPAWWKGDDQNDHSFGNYFADHPSLRGFPHEGYGDLQTFGLLDSRRVVLLDEVPGGIEPIIACLDVPWQMRRKAYLFEARVGRGRLLYTTMDLSPTARAADPAAAALHASLTRYVASPDFQPRAVLPVDWLRPRLSAITPPPVETWLEGYGKLGECTEAPTLWQTYREDNVPVHAVRQTDGAQRLTWQTAVLPGDWKPGTVALVWAGGMGWRSQPDGGAFTLVLNGKPLLDVPFTTTSATWRTADGTVTLQYDVRRTTDEDSFGVFWLSLPAGRLTPGQPATLSVTAPAGGSRRWMSLATYGDVAALERVEW
ncbi:MAG: hypothetical protein HZB16_20395 [Armatimonadetes bacterium]|nr:hypothetical protein [Armatimonadota bacterium]